MKTFCLYCQKEHDEQVWKAGMFPDPNTGERVYAWICRLHFAPTPTKFALKAANYSPEELLSGADLGNHESWGAPKSTKTYSEEKAEALPILTEALNG